MIPLDDARQVFLALDTEASRYFRTWQRLKNAAEDLVKYGETVTLTIAEKKAEQARAAFEAANAMATEYFDTYIFPRV